MSFVKRMLLCCYGDDMVAMVMTWLLGGGVPHRGDLGGGLRVGQHFQTNGLPPFLQCDPPMGDAAYSCRCVCVYVYLLVTLLNWINSLSPNLAPSSFETSHLYAYIHVHIHESAIVVLD